MLSTMQQTLQAPQSRPATRPEASFMGEVRSAPGEGVKKGAVGRPGPSVASSRRAVALSAWLHQFSAGEGGADIVKVVGGGKLVEPSGIEPLTSCMPY